MTVTVEASTGHPTGHPAGPPYTRSRARPAADGWTIAAILIALLALLPSLVVLTGLFEDSAGIWDHLAATVLPEYVVNTVILLFGVGVIALSVGVSTAWLVTMYRFPGSRILEWALLLPLAMPAYVMAYVYTDLLDVYGPVQTGLRSLTGWTPREYWFPHIRSVEGAVLMLGLTLYPYVYLLARSAFLAQSICVLEVSRTLGRSSWRTLTGVGLPLARPALVGGLALALMETMADFGTVSYFGVPTFTTGIYRAWFGMGSPVAASQLASILLLFVVTVVALERVSRGRSRYHHTSQRYREIRQWSLPGRRGRLATVFCALPVLIGFALPASILADYAVRKGDPLFGARFVPFATNSLVLAGLTAVLAVTVAVVLAYGSRLSRARWTRRLARFAALGYAIPGSVIAVGVLIPFAAVDNAVDAFFERTFGISTGLLLTGTIFAIVFAYLCRFMAAAFNTIDSALAKISPSMDQAARTLGHGAGRTLLRVHAPIMRGALLTGGLIVFVDVMKELPATMILRPFDFDTLAIRVYRLASDERLAEASTAALTIVAVGIVPVILLSRAISRSRPGQNGSGAGDLH